MPQRFTVGELKDMSQMPDRAPWDGYVAWVRSKAKENIKKAKSTAAKHAIVRGAAALGAITVPILLNLNPVGAYHIRDGIAISTDMLRGAAAWISFLVALGLALDGLIRWGDLYQNFLSASVQYENELHAFDTRRGDYSGLDDVHGEDLFLKRTTQIYTAERTARISFFSKGTSGDKY